MNTQTSLPRTDKLVIYQAFMRLFGNTNTTNTLNGTVAQNGTGKFSHINHAALQSLKTFGVTHIWFTGVVEHATQTDYSAFGVRPDDPAIVKGVAGSPYAVKDYYDLDPDLANDVPNRMAEFEALIERTHDAGLQVIMDFIPNHVARQYQSDAKPDGVLDLGERDDTSVRFSPQNNFYYLPGKTFRSPTSPSGVASETPPPGVGGLLGLESPAKITGSGSLTEAPDINDWYETVKLNYGLDIFTNWQLHANPIPDTWHKMLDILLFWSAKGIDGFRCDMAHLVPVEFWQWATGRVRAQYPAMLFIAEIYDPGLYHRFIRQGGFDYLYDKVGLYDSLRRLMEDGGTCYDISRVWQRESGDIGQNMLRFLETHDEQRIASRFFANNPFLAIPAMVVTATLHTGPLLLYFGQEIGVKSAGESGFSGDDGRTTIFDYWGVDEWQGYLNNGAFDGAGLTPDQRRLRAFYQQLNQLVLGSDAIRNGAFYDLQYANENNPGYNPHRQYSYLRYTKTQKLLIICNFDRSQSVQTTVRVPSHAFETMGLDARDTFVLTDILLTETSIETVGQAGVPVSLPPLGVLLLEIQVV
jgi:glycosidase